jgi:DNA-binding SARP family transcriptional activator
MDGLHISLFGKFTVECGGDSRKLETQKAEELLAYLLVYRRRSHCREKLATMLWPDSTLSQSKGYLRQTLWHLQSSLDEDNRLLQFESDWIQIDETADFHLDVSIFEKAFSQVQGLHGRQLDQEKVTALREAIGLYQADLLENWYQDWCLFERERLQNIYLTMLGKLVGYFEALEQYDACITYASDILRCDRAHERTYRRLMRIYYMAGDRSGALRTYQRCTAALDDGLGVSPSQRTTSLFELIQSGRRPDSPTSPKSANGSAKADGKLGRLLRLRRTLRDAQQQLDREIETVQLSLKDHI